LSRSAAVLLRPRSHCRVARVVGRNGSPRRVIGADASDSVVIWRVSAPADSKRRAPALLHGSRVLYGAGPSAGHGHGPCPASGAYLRRESLKRRGTTVDASRTGRRGRNLRPSASLVRPLIDFRSLICENDGAPISVQPISSNMLIDSVVGGGIGEELQHTSANLLRRMAGD